MLLQPHASGAWSCGGLGNEELAQPIIHGSQDGFPHFHIRGIARHFHLEEAGGRNANGNKGYKVWQVALKGSGNGEGIVFLPGVCNGQGAVAAFHGEFERCFPI